MSKKILIPVVICLFLCLLCVLLYCGAPFRPTDAGHETASSPAKAPPPPAAQSDPSLKEPTVPEPNNAAPNESAPDVAEPVGHVGHVGHVESDSSEPAEVEPYASPIDFETLQAGNPDIYAWLFIEGSGISFPVVQNADDTFYLTHNVDREPADYGAIFTESAYNSKLFDDRITAIYGHRMYSGEMFGTLQPLYSSQQALIDYSEVIVYLPDQELHYQVFAAVPYDNRHILYNYGDGTARGVKFFLQSISSVKSLDAYIDKDAFASSGDKLIVLSTCLYGNRDRRFLVVAKLV